MKKIVILSIGLSVVIFGFLWVLDKNEEKEMIPKTTTVNVTAEAENEKQEEKVYAVWLTYSEIGSLVKGKTETQYRESIETVFKNLKDNKINTVFYQCRAFCDSFYTSEIFPVSKYITVDTRKLSFDPLEIFLEEVKFYNISVHCWINPYRISYDGELENLPKNSPARKLYKENKNALIICENGIYLNPATDEARLLVLSGIREILNKYDVSGIHFDDYFYPETGKLNDEKLYKDYKKQGGLLDLGDWRRENVNVLVSSVYSLVKAHNETLVFSVSPSADMEKCKNVFYADVEKWCREDGFADYIIPQIYFGFENEKMPFPDVLKEWENLASEGEVKLICGLAPYKCGKTDENAGKGKNEWNENVNILSRQYEQMQKSHVWKGFSLFSYSFCFSDNVNENSKKEIKNLLYMVE